MRGRKTILTEEHHRRPRSLGGTSKPSNISYIEPNKHRAWHILFGNMNVYQIAKKLNNRKEKPKGITVYCKFINGSPVMLKGKHHSNNINKTTKAWNDLFTDLDFEEILHLINHLYLDPSYRLRTKIEKSP